MNKLLPFPVASRLAPLAQEPRAQAALPQEPTDNELLDLMSQQLRGDLADVAMLCARHTGIRPELIRVALTTGILDFVRTVLASRS